MKAVVCRALDGPDGLRVEDHPDQAPGPGQVRITVRACGVNFPDLLMVEGQYQFRPDLPFIPGMEVAGVVADAAPDVTGFHAGDQVMAQMQTGGYAEEATVPAAQLVPLPQRFSFEEGACFLVAYRTAFHALFTRGALQAGETLLVQGAAGGVGLAAVELGRRAGARVIALASTPEKRETALARGADHALDPAADGLVDAVRRLSDGHGADVVYDPVGGPRFDDLLRCLAWSGRLLVVGFASGSIPSVRVNRILLKACSVIGVRVGEAGRRDPAVQAGEIRQLLALAEDGALRPHISHAFPLEAFAQAMQAVRDRTAIGRVVVVPGSAAARGAADISAESGAAGR